MHNPRVVIIDYGMGNIGSVASAFRSLGVECTVSDTSTALGRSDALVMPGVGAFAVAMANLNRLGLVGELENQVLGKKKPFLGICLGMQLLARDSTEGGNHPGLGWLQGHVDLLQPEGNLRVPHVGWNNVWFKASARLFQRIEQGTHFYFDHSFHLQCGENIVASTYEYGGTRVAAVQWDNISATQFHPEKSQRDGLKVLRNFLNSI